MVEILDRLATRYGLTESVPVTPVRIREHLARSNELSAETLYSRMPAAIQAEFVSRKGNPKEKKLKRFLRRLNDLMDEYTPEQLLQIKPDCIVSDGRIKKKTLNRYLYKHGS